jgi:hypothetical protein
MVATFDYFIDSLKKMETTTILIMTLLITLIHAKLLITDFSYYRFYLQMVLPITGNKKLASLIA